MEAIECGVCSSTDLEVQELGGWLCGSCGSWVFDAETLRTPSTARTEWVMPIVSKLENHLCPHGSPLGFGSSATASQCEYLCSCLHDCGVHLDGGGLCGIETCVCSGFRSLGLDVVD